jgi:uncharacterized protein
MMSVAGLATAYLFVALHLVPTGHPPTVAMGAVAWNYTTILNIIALIGFAVLYWLYRNRERFGGGTGYAQAPVCGMQVEIAAAPARAVHDGQRFSFCSDHCQARFTAAPHRYTTAPARGNTVAADADSTAVTTVQGDS